MRSHLVLKGLADALRARTKPPRIERRADDKEYMLRYLNAGNIPLPDNYGNVEGRIAEMDRNGVARSVILNQIQDISALPVEDSVPLCRAYNDAAAAAQ